MATEWNNGHCDAKLSTPNSGLQELTVRARGDPADGTWPYMKILIDSEVVHNFTVSSDTWQTYTTTVDLSQGVHDLDIYYTNENPDDTGDDRNLLVDVASVWG